jgi:hypothetical protein
MTVPQSLHFAKAGLPHGVPVSLSLDRYSIWQDEFIARSCLFFGGVIVGGIRVVLGPRYSNLNLVVVQTAHADNHKHSLPLESTSDSAAPAK